MCGCLCSCERYDVEGGSEEGSEGWDRKSVTKTPGMSWRSGTSSMSERVGEEGRRMPRKGREQGKRGRGEGMKRAVQGRAGRAARGC